MLPDHRFVREVDPAVSAHTPAGVKAFRALCEEALTAGGLHVAQGATLWSIYRWVAMGWWEEQGRWRCEKQLARNHDTEHM